MTVIILQARLDSTRLPRKALLDLEGKPVLVRVMETLRLVQADAYILACDTSSESTLAPLAAECGFTCLAGSKENVLERFCMVIRKTGAITVLRATGDNPFLFADAAMHCLQRFAELRQGPNPPDYYTLSGLPHGSGIEVFSGSSLLHAAVLTVSPYDHEHVGPALYNHTNTFTCIRENAPSVWYHPDMRITIDTHEDYERARLIASYLVREKNGLPAQSSHIIRAWQYVTRPLLFVPAVAPGQGTGHFVRIAGLIRALKSEWRCLLYIPVDSTCYIPDDLLPLVVREISTRVHLVITDGFRISSCLMAQINAAGPVLAIDEGGRLRRHAEYLLDIIPGIHPQKYGPNLFEPGFLPLPSVRKNTRPSIIKNVLVVAGGENAAGLALPVAELFASLDYDVTVIDPAVKGLSITGSGITVSPPVSMLREKLCHYDLVACHYGFTAYEALAAGCRVVLFSPGRLHYRLAKTHGFDALRPGRLSQESLARLLAKGETMSPHVGLQTQAFDLPAAITWISSGDSRACPLCGEKKRPSIFARFRDRTYARCRICGMRYILYSCEENRTYTESYFFDEYRSQYGKTYLEDFDSIKLAGSRRIAVIDSLLSRTPALTRENGKTLLDIGCAYGPFLAAAAEVDWEPAGTDISPDAVAYVRDTLKLPASVSAFPAPDEANLIDSKLWTAVTLWYVIEHFQDLEPVLARIRKILVPGGILAFSTPSASGVSGLLNSSSFWKQSPRDHYSIWNPHLVRRQLARYGFAVKKIVITGHHPERFPFMKNVQKESFLWTVCTTISRLFSLGDTFEVYAVKNGILEEISK